MATRYLIDTDVLIEYLRGSEQAIRYIEGLKGELLVSIITVAELYCGVRGEDEERAMEQFLLAFELLSVDSAMAKKGGLYRRQYGATHGTGLADALIAASAAAANATLVTFNRRHYPMLRRIKAPYGRR